MKPIGTKLVRYLCTRYENGDETAEFLGDAPPLN
jgi:hypothetical protein